MKSMQMDDKEKKNLEVERLCLIDVSSEDDCLIASPNGFSENQNERNYFELSEVGNAQESEDPDKSFRQRVQEPMLFESLEPEIPRKVGKCNLRKSLAWDTAFFTSAGVLDPEELSIINGGLKKSDMHSLPEIQEDIRRSAESNSTLDSDSLTLESLEVDLFEDIRASIQRSSKATKVACSSNKAGMGESGMQRLLSSKTVELASRNKMKPMAASKRQSINMHGLEKSKKEAFVRPQALQAAARTGVPSALSLKPPKILGRANPISSVPSKRSSLAANRVKIEITTAKTTTGRREHVVPSKTPGFGDSSENLKSTPSPKSSSSVSATSATKRESTPSYSSSYNKSGSTSSNSTGKSPLKFLRIKTDSGNANPASGSTLKTPLRISPRNKIESGNSRLSAYLMSMPKLTSSISPASSIDGWSTESSSSTSTVNQRSNSSKSSTPTVNQRSSNSKKSLDISSPRKGFSLERDAPQTSSLQPGVECESQGMGLPSQCTKKASFGSGVLSHPPSTNVSRSFKPSGLRMPSPKIGFFDAEKTVVETPKVGLQVHPGARGVLPKNGPGVSNLNGVTFKATPSKHQPARTVTGTSGVKVDSQQAGVLHSASRRRPTSSTQHQELSNASPKVQNDASLGSIREVREVTDADKSGLVSVLNAEENGGQDALKINVGTKIEKLVHKGAIKTTPIEDGDHISSTASADVSYGTSNKSGENPIYVQGHLKNDSHLHHKSIEKEDPFCLENQVDGLSRRVEDIDLNMEDLIVKKNSPLSQSDVNSIGGSGDSKLTFSNCVELPVHKEDFTEILTKPTPLSISPSCMAIIPSTRTPLAVKLSFYNRSKTFELASESTVEKISICPFPQGMQKDNS